MLNESYADGFIEQWGYVAGQSNVSTYSVSFAVQFTTATYIPMSVMERDNARGENVTVDSRTVSSMSIHTENSNRASYWIAKGY